MLNTIIFVLVLHLIADFILQPNWIQTYKSRNNLILLLHVSIYFGIFALGLSLFFNFKAAIIYAACNAALHFLVDWITSRVITSHAKTLTLDSPEQNDERPVKALYERVNLYLPSLLLGVDQLFHHVCLIFTLSLLS